MVAAPFSLAILAASQVSGVPRMEQITASVFSPTNFGVAKTNSLLVKDWERSVRLSLSIKYWAG